jgi:predicted dehydrogenase
LSKPVFGIIGAGLIGRKRTEALLSLGFPVAAVSDVDSARATVLATEAGGIALSPEALIAEKKIDAVVIATFHQSLASLAQSALERGKHVFVEKPAGRNRSDLEKLKGALLSSSGKLAVGYNHRFHPALRRAKEIVSSGELGPFLYIRAHYGHGGRLGYEKEWRARPELSGGGELIDQGSHLIDLSRWIGGAMELAHGHAQTFFWNMPVDDNAFLLLRSPDGKRFAHLHASCTEWKNAFSFEIFCQKGKLHITGLGRSYGAEELKIYRMQPEMGPPPMEQISFNKEDFSWRDEMEAFVALINGKPSEIGRIEDAYATMDIIEATYENSGYKF